MIKEVGENESRSYWALMKNSEVNNKQKNKYWKLNTIYQFGLKSARVSYIEEC